MKPNIFIFLAVVFFSVPAFSEVVNGIYQTEKNESGAFLEVEFGPCKENSSLSCATILKAYRTENDVNTGYEHLGKTIVGNMKASGDGNFKGGTIWDPSEDKTYNSKMAFLGNDLSVEGCILFFCKAQLWKKID